MAKMTEKDDTESINDEWDEITNQFQPIIECPVFKIT